MEIYNLSIVIAPKIEIQLGTYTNKIHIIVLLFSTGLCYYEI